MTAPLLQVDELAIGIGAERSSISVVRGVSLQLAAGEALGLVGESGSGKTMTALAIARLLPRSARVTHGTVRFDGKDLLSLPEAAMRRMRGAAIGVVFQDPLTSLNPALSVGSQLLDSVRAHLPLGRAAARTRVLDLLAQVGIPNPSARARSYPHELSGGMRQRVGIALALSGEPRLLIADEPTTALDVTVQASIMDLLARLIADLHLALLFISHNLDLVAQICDRVSVMYAGSIVESGAVEALFAAPAHPYTQALIRCIPRLDGRTGPMDTIAGNPPGFGVHLPGCRFAPRCDRVVDLCRQSMPPLVGAAGHLAACWRPTLSSLACGTGPG